MAAPSDSDTVRLTIHDVSGEVLFADWVAMRDTAQSLLRRVCQLHGIDPAMATLVHDDKVLGCGSRGTCNILGHQLTSENHVLTLIKLTPPPDYDYVAVCFTCDEIRCVYVWGEPDYWGLGTIGGSLCRACGGRPPEPHTSESMAA